MQAGLTQSKAEINQTAGMRARNLRDALADVRQFKDDLDATTEQTLLDLGFTAEEVATLRSAYTDLAKLEAIFRGADTQAVAADMRVFPRRIWGIG